LQLKTIYCISGLGADAKAFSRLRISGYELKVIDWITPLPKESLAGYAARMREQVPEEKPLLMGLSFGGIMCQEIARQIPVERVILISSIKTAKELPGWMRTVAFFSLHKIFPLKSTALTAPLQNRFLGVTGEFDKRIAEAYRKAADPKYVRWAVDHIVNWKNLESIPQVTHIHGDKDRIFPIKNIQADEVVPGGGHFMIMNRADEVSERINKLLTGHP